MAFANNDLRMKAKEAGVRFWEIADEMKISEPTMTRILRYELPEQEKEKILRIIEDLAAKKKEG